MSLVRARPTGIYWLGGALQKKFSTRPGDFCRKLGPGEGPGEGCGPVLGGRLTRKKRLEGGVGLGGDNEPS